MPHPLHDTYNPLSQQRRLEDMSGLVYDVVEKRRQDGPYTVPTFEDLAVRSLREASWWGQRGDEAREAGNQGAAAFANCNAMERYARAHAIIEHPVATCPHCKQDLNVPHEWVLGAHVVCYAEWNDQQLT